MPSAPNFRLREIRERRNESREEFAAQVRKKGAELGENVGCTKRHVAAWEDGDIKWPRPVYRRVLSALLGVTPEEMGFASSNNSRTKLTTEAKEGTGGLDVLNRRIFTVGAIGAAAGGVGVNEGLDRSASGESVISAFDGSVDLKAVPFEISSIEQRVGGAAVLDLAVAQLRLFQHLSRGFEGLGKRKDELNSAVGWIGRIAAWSAFDAGNPHLARLLFGEARAYAAVSGDTLLSVEIANLLSRQEIQLGNPRGALDIISLAYRESPREFSHSKVRALFLVREAQANAMLGRSAEMRIAEREGMACFAAGSTKSDLWWLDFLTESEISRQLGNAYLDFGNPERAVTLLRNTVNASRDKFTRNDTYWQILLAQALALSGEKDEAAAVAGGVMQGHWVSGSARVRSQLMRFSSILDPKRDGVAARSFHEQLRDLGWREESGQPSK